MMNFNRRTNSSTSRRGLSMVETVMAMAMVSVLLVAALNTLGASQLGQKNTSVHTIGNALAQTLMAEIMSQAYEDPDGSPIFGPEMNEWSLIRVGYDDVDDYAYLLKRAPQKKDGTLVQVPAGWERAASVTWINPGDLTKTVASDNGFKRITVTTTYNGKQIAQLVAVRTAGPPEPTIAINVLFVVVDPANLTLQETAKRDLLVSWGFTLQLIAQTDSVANFLSAGANNDVAYISSDVTDLAFPRNINSQALGIVNEQWDFIDDFGFGTNPRQVSETSILVYDNTHYIMSGYANAMVLMLTTVQPIFLIDGTLASGAQQVGLLLRSGVVYYPSLVVIDRGAALYGGGNAADRRVQLPWGGPTFDINALTNDGRTFMKRSIEWAASKEVAPPPPPPAVCGDATCNTGEDSCNCAVDCGAPLALETPGVDCADGLDNDCDGKIDCADLNCATDMSCTTILTICGNGICESGEDCNSCGVDCKSKTNGNPSGRYCCGDGTLQAAEGTGAICDGNP